MTCKFVLKNGKICSRNPIKDGYCWQHNPSSSTSISVSASTEKKSVEKKSVEKKSVEKKSVEKKSVEKKSVEKKSVEKKSVGKESPVYFDEGYKSNEIEAIKEAIYNQKPLEYYREYIEKDCKSPISYRQTRNDKILRMNLHHGQRKLLEAEMRGFLYIIKKYKLKDTPLKVLYVGGGPADHNPILSELFPNITFILVDPTKFNIKETEKTKIVNKFFADKSMLKDNFFKNIEEKSGLEYAEKYTDTIDIFISDIRLYRHGLGDLEESNEDVKRDLENQERWMSIVKPKYGGILKFRFPFDNKPVKYLDGKVFIQTWGPQSSTESRLIVPPLKNGKFKYRKWDIKNYEDWFYYHNYIVRSWLNFPNDEELYKIEGFDGCYDCSAEVETWKDYIAFYKTKHDVKYYINYVSEKLHQPLLYKGNGKDHPHGRIKPQIPFSLKRKEIYDKFGSFSLNKYINK